MTRWIDYSPHEGAPAGKTGKKTAYYDRVKWMEIPNENTRVAALQTHEVDIVGEFAQDAAQIIQDDASLVLHKAATPQQLQGIMNHTKPPFNNVKIRRAFMMAYDAEKALRAAVGDPDFWRLCGSTMMCGSKLQNTAGEAGIYNAKNIEGAKKIVAEEGMVGTEVTILSAEERSQMRGVALVARETLEAIGFKVNYVPTDWATISQRRTKPDLWDFFVTWWGGGRVELNGMLTRKAMHKNRWHNKYQDTTGKMTILVDKISKVKSIEEARPLYVEYNQLVYDDGVLLPVGEMYSVWAATKNLKFVGATPANPLGLRSTSRACCHYDSWLEVGRNPK
jgi:peptide/nickel transport system substrate-binding protein